MMILGKEGAMTIFIASVLASWAVIVIVAFIRKDTK
jgi:hypothetical protein